MRESKTRKNNRN